MILETIVTTVRRVLPDCDYLRKAEYRKNSNPYAGHCYVASEAIYHLAKDAGIALKPMFVRHEDSPHWYLLHHGCPVDATSDQFSSSVNYDSGRGKGFLTKRPSKRASILIELCKGGADE